MRTRTYQGYLTHPFSTSCSAVVEFAAAAAGAYCEGLMLGSASCWKFEVRLTDACRASSTILGVKILGRFSMWWAAQ